MTTIRTTLPRTRKTTVRPDSRVIPFVIQRAPGHDAVVHYDSPTMSFVVARQAVRELRQVIVVAFAAAVP
ncbi:hypothetical protein ABZ473_26930 [Streptomyces cellulosae]